MFKKIPLFIPGIDIDRLHGEPFEIISPNFRSYHIKDAEYLGALLKDKIRFRIAPSFTILTIISNNCRPVPHTDGTCTALNYYIDLSPADTIFWRQIGQAQAQSTTVLLNGSVTQVRAQQYNQDDLEFVDSFQASKNEAYLLNVNQIHSVQQRPNGADRVFIRWVWETTEFDQVLESLEILA